MKKIFALFLTLALLTTLMPIAFANSNPVEYVTDKITVVVQGEAGNAYIGRAVTLLLLKGNTKPSDIASTDDILGIDETIVDSDGKYEFEVGLKDITFDENNLSDGHLFIRVGQDDITDTVISAYAEYSKHFFADMKIKADENGKYANLTVRAPKNIKDDVVFVVVQYDEYNRLISVEKPEAVIENGGLDLSISIVPAENAKYCRAYGWYSNMAPITKEITSEKAPQNVLIIGNSFSIDSARYVNQIAASLGINMDVYVYQIGGATVELLYNQRENAVYYNNPSDTSTIQGWYASKNGLSISTNNKSLDEFLNDNAFDAIVLQNYWGTSNGIAYYDKSETTDSYEGIPSPAYVNMAKYIKEKQPNAQILINAIWSNEPGGPMSNYASNNYYNNGFETASAYMYDLIEKYNGQSAIDIGATTLDNESTIGIKGSGVKQLPVGYAVQYARNYQDANGDYIFKTSHNWADYGYADADGIYDFPQPDGKIRLNRDGYHLSITGRYLAGCVWVEALTGMDVRNATFCPDAEILSMGMIKNETQTWGTGKTRFPEMSAQDAALLRSIAHTATEKFNSQDERTLSSNSLSLK